MEEDVLHAIRDRANAREIWEALATGNIYSEFFNLDLRSWFVMNLKKGTRGGGL